MNPPKTFTEQHGLPVFTERFGVDSATQEMTSPLIPALKKLPRTADVDGAIAALEAGDPRGQLAVAKIIATLAARLRPREEKREEPKPKPKLQVGPKPRTPKIIGSKVLI